MGGITPYAAVGTLLWLALAWFSWFILLYDCVTPRARFRALALGLFFAALGTNGVVALWRAI